MILIGEVVAAVDSQREAEGSATTEEVEEEAQVLDNSSEVECEVKCEKIFVEFQINFKFSHRFPQ